MQRTSREDRQARQRIVALLFAFAALADCAGTKPRPVRIVVLWLLRAVESIAWDFVVAVAHESGVDPDLAMPPCAHEIGDDAGRLARSFAALAEFLADLMDASPSPSPAGRVSGPVERFMQAIWPSAQSPAALMPPFPDTS